MKGEEDVAAYLSSVCSGTAPASSVEGLTAEGEDFLFCRFCYGEDELENLSSPCSCSGTMKYVHRKCLERWCSGKGDTICDICHQPYKDVYEGPYQSYRSHLEDLTKTAFELRILTMANIQRLRTQHVEIMRTLELIIQNSSAQNVEITSARELRRQELMTPVVENMTAADLHQHDLMRRISSRMSRR